MLEAKEQALISSIPDMSNKVETKNIIKGECWEPNQIKTIFDKLTKWQSLSPTNTDRVIFNLYCRFLYLTGIRTGNEALGVRWDDLKTEKDYYLKVRKGKMAAFFKIVVAQSCFKQPLFAPARVSRAAPDLASRHR
ncbi:hypothetical protein LOS88_06705 [Aeromonas veronii]|uniref:hypothetical protein n=2 Tax=Aeromonas veronii TaxID=654 RepID=UPI001FD6B5D7|nr:hypothetical protein [Aeromonas veronii]UOR20329.1 hypothetical protein LOS88_06705 [Aeromonas veronii]